MPTDDCGPRCVVANLRYRDQPMPDEIYTAWIVFLVSFVTLTTWWFKFGKDKYLPKDTAKTA